MHDDLMTRRRFWALIILITVTGFTLRVAASLGGLWLDEAVSAVHVRDTGAAMGVFLRINHDNNHHTTSLWMQLVGFGAHPLVVRALSIVTGTAAIVIAGLLGQRRGALLGIITAAVFAISPILVTLGSEARGYAPMSLALLTAILLIDRWLAGDTEYDPAVALALCFLLGAFSQLVMVFAFCAMAGWVVATLWLRHDFRTAITRTLRLLTLSVVALCLVGAVIWGAAAASPTGFRFGSYDPFAWRAFFQGLSYLIGYTLGIAGDGAALYALAVILVLIAVRARVSRFPFHLLAVITFPVMIAVLQPGNTGYARYYLLVAIALLILAAELAWLGLRLGGVRRWLSGGALALFATGSIAADVDLIRNRRGDPASAVTAMQAKAPQGAVVFVDSDRNESILIYAAAVVGYPIDIRSRPCPAGRFAFVGRAADQAATAAPAQFCGRKFVPIAAADARGLSGTDWTLYERRP